MKKTGFVILLFLSSISSFSQLSGLNLKVGPKGLFVEHLVAPKESIYSIGREFTVHPRRLAAFNGLDVTKGLTLGQLIHIPLSDTNLLRSGSSGVAVYFQSSSKQTVGTISAVSKTSGESLRQLNNLSSDAIPANTRLIIGYLMSETTAGIAQTADTVQANSPAATTVIQEKKESPLMIADTAKITAVNTVKAATLKAESKVQPAPKVKEETNKAIKEEPGAFNMKQQPMAGPNTMDGYFKAVFIQQVKIIPLSKEETVTSGIFKTLSGWKDAKFYALLDGVEPGTIIKVINPDNNKEVYAKVLGQMAGMRQNQGLNLRISNAAAAALEIAETDKFIVKLSY